MQYYRREADSQIEIYRAQPSKRYIMCTLAGYFPVLQKLADGTLAAIVRGGDLHVGERGWVGITTSADGGESWSRVQRIASDGPDNRNPAFCQTSAGTLVLTYKKLGPYVNGEWQRNASQGQVPFPIHIRRSNDGGRTWGEEETVFPINELTEGSPFGKIIELPDETLLMNLYGRTTEASGEYRAWVVRSRDDGQTWGDSSCIAVGFGETALLYLPSGKLLAMMRRETPPYNVWQTESWDGGYTWSEPKPITGDQEHPADLIRLTRGRLLLTFGHRQPPYGVRALVSHDDGETWEFDQKIILVSESTSRDCGYPSSIQRDDGKIFTAYYAYESQGPWAMWRAGLSIGVHAAGVLYDEDDLP